MAQTLPSSPIPRTRPKRPERGIYGEHQEPCDNCAESGFFAFFPNSQFERIPKSGLTEAPPDCHTILGALHHQGLFAGGGGILR